MRWVSLPEELTALHLLDLSLGPPILRDALSRVHNALAAGDPGGALGATLRVSELALSQHDRYSGALAYAVRADLLRRMMRWEDSLDALRRSLHWLELSVSPVAHYNEAIAVYLEGVVHYVLHADEKASATFAYATASLEEAERHFGFEQNAARVSDCRNIIRWMSQLLTLQEGQTGVASLAMSLTMPVYELANRVLIRTDAVVLPPFEIMIPHEVVARYCPSELVPLQMETVSFPSLRHDIQYAAIRLDDAPGFRDAKRGDLLIIEVTGTGAASGELVLTEEQPFVRRSDGRVEFASAPRGVRSGGAVPGLVGIPRALIRDGEDV